MGLGLRCQIQVTLKRLQHRWWVYCFLARVNLPGVTCDAARCTGSDRR